MKILKAQAGFQLMTNISVMSHPTHCAFGNFGKKLFITLQSILLLISINILLHFPVSLPVAFLDLITPDQNVHLKILEE